MRTGPVGLSEREAQRRELRYGPNELQQARRTGWLPRLVSQFTHLLALLRNRPITAAVSAGEVRS